MATKQTRVVRIVSYGVAKFGPGDLRLRYYRDARARHWVNIVDVCAVLGASAGGYRTMLSRRPSARDHQATFKDPETNAQTRGVSLGLLMYLCASSRSASAPVLERWLCELFETHGQALTGIGGDE